MVLPLLMAGLAVAAGRRPRLQRAMSISTLVVTTVGAAVLLVRGRRTAAPRWCSSAAGRRRRGSAWWATGSRCCCCVTSQVVLLAVLLYAVGQGIADGHAGGTLAVFHPVYLVLAAGVSLAS